MSDATQRGGGLAAVYRSITKRENGMVRIDRNKAVAEAKKCAAKGNKQETKPSKKSY